MDLFNVYALSDVTVDRALGSYVFDTLNNKYLDMYGGHAVISIGHTHPHYVKRITDQLSKIGFYSNSVKLELWSELTTLFSEVSGYSSGHLFLCNSGAEANENALKLASFTNGRKKVLAFKNSFHGRTSLAVACTDNKNLISPLNETHDVIFIEPNDIDFLRRIFNAYYDELAAVIIEPIQGIGGVNIFNKVFLKELRTLCTAHNVIFIADEVQCGYGRSGSFFALDTLTDNDIKADIYTMAKGMGNGFPVAGLLISSIFKAKYGMLGTTFGGNPLATAAAIAVLEVIKSENLISNAKTEGEYLLAQLILLQNKFPTVIKEVRGKGLMIGVELFFDASQIKSDLLYKELIFTGGANSKAVIRILPSLAITRILIDEFLSKFEKVLASHS